MTGASSGIGRAIAEAYAAEGAVVLLTHRDSPGRAREVADAIAADGGRALVRQARKDTPPDAAAESQGLAPRHGRAFREIFQLVREQLTNDAPAAGDADGEDDDE